MITIKKLSECSFADAVEAWNKGFEGYFFDATTTIDRFLTRLAMEGLSAELSIVAFQNEDPVGIVLSGVRTIDGKKVAWNGGTGVAAPLRRHGVGRRLMHALLDVYRDAGIDTAILEAFRQNDKAIALYQEIGYEIIDHLVFLQRTDAIGENVFYSEGESKYQLKRGIPHDVRSLSFYRSMSPWQTQWPSVRDGESLTILDAAGEAVGYAIYKRAFDEAGKLLSITLMQCEAAPGREDGDDIVRFALSHLFAPFDLACRRTTFNLPVSNQRLVATLEEAGFTGSTEQVYMKMELERA